MYSINKMNEQNLALKGSNQICFLFGLFHFYLPCRQKGEKHMILLISERSSSYCFCGKKSLSVSLLLYPLCFCLFLSFCLTLSHRAGTLFTQRSSITSLHYSRLIFRGGPPVFVQDAPSPLIAGQLPAAVSLQS